MATSVIKGINKTTETVGSIDFNLINGVVYVVGTRTIVLNAGAYADIGTLTTPFRPKATLYLPIVIDPNGSRLGVMRIKTDGLVSLLSNVGISSGTAMNVNGAYPVL